MAARGTPANDPKVRDTNPDAITGEPGSHPVGAGLGAAAGGAAAGAAAGAVAGPIGAAAGAVVGGIAGAYAGKGIAEQIDPTAETDYWREEFPNRPYYDDQAGFEEYEPAYRYGWESRARHHDRSWAELEPELQREWETQHSSKSDLAWEKARRASRDAWDRIETTIPGDADQDGR